VIKTLSIDQVMEVLRSTPEQAVFDWKRDFVVPTTDEARAEFLKDVVAIANAITTSDGFVFYGVDPHQANPVVGIGKPYDDAALQQFVHGKVEPNPSFLYYQLHVENKIVGVLQVTPAPPRPFIIRVDVGKLRKGQILIRRGSSTDGVTLQDLFAMFYNQNVGYFPRVAQNMTEYAQVVNAQVAMTREAAAAADRALDDMEMITGVPLR
jgi:predicted HTH transcriptional regulator